MVAKSPALNLEKYADAPEPGTRRCEWPNCAEHGEHRAPRSRDEMNSYRWFCRDHAREYNKTWNYFAGMSDDEVEADRRADTVWRRPSWPLGDGPPTPEQARAFWRGDFSDPFKVFDEAAADHKSEPQPTIGSDVRKAFEVFSLEPPVTIEEVKATYKALVKRHHPDASRNTADDGRIKDINEAYQVILTFLAP